jgi:hypothetical protein
MVIVHGRDRREENPLRKAQGTLQGSEETSILVHKFDQVFFRMETEIASSFHSSQ